MNRERSTHPNSGLFSDELWTRICVDDWNELSLNFKNDPPFFLVQDKKSQCLEASGIDSKRRDHSCLRRFCADDQTNQDKWEVEA